MISRKKAWAYFTDFAMPRRVQYYSDIPGDHATAQVSHYRKVGPEEESRGEPYPLCHDGINTFGHFGIGIGIYFAQLIILAVVCFVAGFIMVAAGQAYAAEDYGLSDPTVPISAACALIAVNATSNCPNGEAYCTVTYRPNCSLPYQAAAADLAMCFLLVMTIFFSKFVETQIEVKLDESIQTAQDYSIEVLDPNDDADDPDEWKQFFSQFGQVVYVTIIRRNAPLTELLVRKHQIVLKLKESGVLGSPIAGRREKYIAQLREVDKLLSTAFHAKYPVCRVYVTFENEIDQRRCVEELEVPDMQAMLDARYSNNILQEHRFRGVNVLNIREPPEPDNIIWKNIEMNTHSLLVKKLLSYVLTFGLMCTFWFLVNYTSSNSLVLAVVIGIVDSALPYIMPYLTDLVTPQTEGTRQASLQMRLFGARLLLTTLIPYIQSSWREVLSDEYITRVFTVQVTACFTAPLLALIDAPGLFYRHVAVHFSDTQEEYNSYFQGTELSLAEQYTGIARVLFVSLFYSLLTPLSILLCSVAFVVIFVINNFLLLRRWKASSMLDSKIALRLRQQAVLAVAAHMYCTMRYIYSWPMDDVTALSDGSLAFVDKDPPLSPFAMRPQEWFTESQQEIFGPYRTCFAIIAIMSLYMWIVEPFSKFMFRMFCYNLKIASNTSTVPFTAVPSINIYFPTLLNWDKKYLSSFSKFVLFRHRPKFIDAMSMEKDDLSTYVPISTQPKVLSVVKFFGSDSQHLAHVSEAREDSTKPSRTVLERVGDYFYDIYYTNLFVPLAYHYERAARRKQYVELANSHKYDQVEPTSRRQASSRRLVPTSQQDIELGTNFHHMEEQVPLILKSKPAATNGVGSSRVLADTTDPVSAPDLTHTVPSVASPLGGNSPSFRPAEHSDHVVKQAADDMNMSLSTHPVPTSSSHVVKNHLQKAHSNLEGHVDLHSSSGRAHISTTVHDPDPLMPTPSNGAYVEMSGHVVKQTSINQLPYEPVITAISEHVVKQPSSNAVIVPEQDDEHVPAAAERRPSVHGSNAHIDLGELSAGPSVDDAEGEAEESSVYSAEPSDHTLKQQQQQRG